MSEQTDRTEPDPLSFEICDAPYRHTPDSHVGLLVADPAPTDVDIGPWNQLRSRDAHSADLHVDRFFSPLFLYADGADPDALSKASDGSKAGSSLKRGPFMRLAR